MYRFMESEDFERVIVDTGLFNDLLSKPDIGVCFNKSLETYVDEVNKDLHM